MRLHTEPELWADIQIIGYLHHEIRIGDTVFKHADCKYGTSDPVQILNNVETLCSLVEDDEMSKDTSLTVAARVILFRGLCIIIIALIHGYSEVNDIKTSTLKNS